MTIPIPTCPQAATQTIERGLQPRPILEAGLPACLHRRRARRWPSSPTAPHLLHRSHDSIGLRVNDAWDIRSLQPTRRFLGIRGRERGAREEERGGGGGLTGRRDPPGSGWGPSGAERASRSSLHRSVAFPPCPLSFPIHHRRQARERERVEEAWVWRSSRAGRTHRIRPDRAGVRRPRRVPGCNSFAMESGTEEKAKMESLTSPAAFVEGGIQDACDDACSICLEAFCESDPSALTTCKHEFHLQCILEWCQRSSQCPMCWQPISMKDPTSQELLEAVERERNVRTNQTLNTTIFHHPALGDIELQHLPVGNDSELEERILQHLAAAAAMGRSHHFGRREGHRGRSGSHNRPQFLVFSAHPNSPSAGAVSSSSAHGEGDNDSNPATPRAVTPSPRANFSGETGSQSPGMLTYDAEQDAVVSSGNSTPVSSPRFFNRRHSTVQSTPDRAGPSDMQSFSDSLKSRLNAVSMKYKESITKSTRGWKERLFSRNSSVADLGSEVKREVNAGIASVSRMMERLETRSGSRTGDNPTASTSDVSPSNESNNERAVESSSITAAATTTTTSASSSSTPCVTTSGSN